MKQLALPIETRTEPRFDTFVPGRNALALRQLQVMADGDKAFGGPAPCYLWGPSGSGKTHLLRALAAGFRQRGAALAWFTPDDAAPWRPVAGDDSVIDAGAHPLPATPPAALIVLDGCDDFDAAQQRAAFSLFVEAAGPRPCVIAAAGRLPPVDLGLREDLRTRLGWGHVMALEPLSEADSRIALRQAAQARGLALTDEVTNHLLNRSARDLKHLMAQLDRLDRHALQSRRAISLPMLRNMLAEPPGAR